MKSQNNKIYPTKFLVIFLIAFSTDVFGQLNMDLLKGMKPRNIGPAGMSGRVTAIDVVNDQPEIIYAGTASGGLWKSESGGINWKPIFEKEAVASIGSIAIQQSNPDVVWAGTGEGNPRNSLNGGYGIYKSLDGGKNWKLMGLENTRNIHRVIVDKDNPDVVYVGAIGSPWGEHPERGVFKTIDGGKSWKKVLYVDQKTGCADLVVDPTNPNKLIAAMWEHRRKPWTFNSGGPGSGLYITYDGGDTWEKKTDEDGLPKGDLGRMGLAIAPSKPNIVYALIEAKKNALYKSEDGGFKWKKISDKPNIGNRPFYYSDIFVDPKNENRIYSLFSLVNVSEDGGKSFRTLLPYFGPSGVHPDHHAWWIHPDDPSYMIDGNDGGLNITHDMGKSWRFAENLPLAQFYHISVDNEIPYNVYGGMQVNGSWAGPAYVWKSGGIRNSYWQELMFGDGFDVVPDADDARFGFAMSQRGNVGRYDRLTGHSKFVQPTHPDADIKLRFNWNAAISQDPFDHSTIYFGSQFVHKSTDKGNTWQIISPDLTTNDQEKQKQNDSGGLTIDATGAENNTTILAISPSAVQQGVIWVGTDDGYVQISRDGGDSWTNLTSEIVGMPKEAWIPQIRVSTYNAGEALVVVNNYRNFDFKPYLFHTTDYGQTWSNLVNESKVWGYTLAVIQDPVEPNLIFLGTEYGLYVSIDLGQNWTKWTNDYPTVSTMDLTIHPREHDLVIGTYGRAAWVIDDIRPLREIANTGKQVLDKKLHVFDPPEGYITMNQQATGTRFSANAIYTGDNRSRGAMISYVVNKPEDKKEEPKPEDDSKSKRKSKKAEPQKEEPESETENDDKPKVKYDSLTLEVFNSNGSLIRTLKRKTPKDNGLNRIYWRMNEKGIRNPSRDKPKANASEPGGVTVLPGNYKLRITFGDQKDSSNIKVNFDPRLNIPQSILEARYAKLKENEAGLALASEAMKRLRDSKAIVDDYIKKMKAKDEEDFKELIKENKAVNDSISNLMDIFVGKDDKRQGITRDPDPFISTYFFRARRYLQSTLAMPGPTEERLMQQAKDKLKPAIEKVNAFFDTQWKAYREKMEKVDLSPFKEYEPIK